jgi:competence protein ComEA
MSTGLKWFWTVLAFILLGVTVIAASLAWSNRIPVRAVEITIPSQPAVAGKVYISGNVSLPGIYPFTDSDTLSHIISAAGAGNSSSSIRLYVPSGNESTASQKVDINRADAWLLEALPGIGATLAQRIVEYRQKNGPFRTCDDLMNVPGIGSAAYERIKDLITVAG